MPVRLSRLPEFLDRWQVAYQLVDGWETRSRSSGDFLDVMGVIVHHTATSLPVERDLTWQYTNSPDRPIGNGLLARDGVFHLGAVRATNTAGKGGPRLTSRGVIPLDAANSRTFNIEASNNGQGEPWTAPMVDAYPRLCAAVIDCVNQTTPGARLGAGDVFAHFEWTGRKIDPAGPSPWCDHTDRYLRWRMDEFRGAVFQQLYAGPPQEDEVTDDDIERIAQRSAELVWDRMLTNHVAGEQQPARQLLEFTHVEAYNAAHG